MHVLYQLCYSLGTIMHKGYYQLYFIILSTDNSERSRVLKIVHSDSVCSELSHIDSDSFKFDLSESKGTRAIPMPND